LDDWEKRPRASTAMAPSPALALGVLAAYLVGAVGAFFLFIFLGDRSFGTQIATVLVYSYFAFWYIFVPKYDPRNKTVQQQIPRLIAIHCGFLILLFIGQTVLFGMKPRLPSYWLTPHGKQGDTLYGALIFVPVIVFTMQVFILRGILSRSLKGSDMPSSIDKM